MPKSLEFEGPEDPSNPPRVEPLDPLALFVGSVRFTILIPGDVEIGLPKLSLPLSVSGSTTIGWELVFQCLASNAALDDREPCKLHAIPCGAQLDGPSDSRTLWLTVTPRPAIGGAFGFVAPDPDCPPIVWYFEP